MNDDEIAAKLAEARIWFESHSEFVKHDCNWNPANCGYCCWIVIDWMESQVPWKRLLIQSRYVLGGRDGHYKGRIVQFGETGKVVVLDSDQVVVTHRHICHAALVA